MSPYGLWNARHKNYFCKNLKKNYILFKQKNVYLLAAHCPTCMFDRIQQERLESQKYEKATIYIKRLDENEASNGNDVRTCQKTCVTKECNFAIIIMFFSNVSGDI